MATEPCEGCGGTGDVGSDFYEACDRCQGSGKERTFGVQPHPCPNAPCRGYHHNEASRRACDDCGAPGQ